MPSHPGSVGALTLTLSVFRHSQHGVTLQIHVGDDQENSEYISTSEITTTFDLAALRERSLDPRAYGQELTDQALPSVLQSTILQAWESTAHAGRALRLSIAIDDPEGDLHLLRWETLLNTATLSPMALSERLLLSRSTPDRPPRVIHQPPNVLSLRTLIAVASPRDSNIYGLSAIDVAHEVRLVQESLSGPSLDIVGQHPLAHSRRATFSAIAHALRSRPHIFYLVCHGRIYDGEAYLCLENDAGLHQAVRTLDFVEQIADLDVRPAVIILAVCHSAGSGQVGMYNAIGPQLARAGIGAVIGFQGDVGFDTIHAFVPTCMRELQRDGHIERAVAAARAELRDGGKWWQAVLWSNLFDGIVWIPQTTAEKPRTALIQSVRQVVIDGLLTRLLAYVPLLQLQLIDRPDLTSSAFPERYQEMLSSSSHRVISAPIDSLYDRAGGSLLILGAPGSGKTVLLLQLCSALLGRAEYQRDDPIPVVLNLAAWAQKRLVLAEWVVEEMYAIYHSETHLIQQWLVDGQLTLLLDGLDEVPEDARGLCIEQINAFQQQYQAKLVVCARDEIYQSLSIQLKVARAVVLQALIPTQVVEIVSDAGAALFGLHKALAERQDLAELATSPLMLSVLAQTYLSGGEVPRAAVHEKSHVWDVFVRTMLMRRGRIRQYHEQQILRWLSWLADRMQLHGTWLFDPDQLQPYWLGTRLQIQLFRFVEGLAGFLIMTPIALSPGFILELGFGVTGAISIAGFVSIIIGGGAWYAFAFARDAGTRSITGGTLALSWEAPISLAKEFVRQAMKERSNLLRMLLASPIIACVALIPNTLKQAMTTRAWPTNPLALLSALIIEAQSMATRAQLANLLAAMPALIAQALAIGFGSVFFITVVFGLIGAPSGQQPLTSNTLQAAALSRQRMLLRNGAIGILVMGLPIGTLCAVGYALIGGALGLRNGDAVALALRGAGGGFVGGALMGGIFGALLFGGQELLGTIGIRLILRIQGLAPLRYRRFLDFATERLLMLRTSGGYQFYHQLLREYLANKATSSDDLEAVAILVRHAGHIYSRTSEQLLVKQQLYTRALTIREHALGFNHSSTLECAEKLAGLYEEQGNVDLAQSLCERALDSYQRSPLLRKRDDIKRIVDLQHLLARLLVAADDHTAAIPLLQQALAVLERPSLAAIFFARDWDQGRVCDLLGQCFRKLGDDASAQNYLERAIISYSAEIIQYNPTMPAYTHQNLAQIGEQQGDYQRAQYHTEQSVALCESYFNATSAALLIMGLVDLMRYARRRGEFEVATQYAQRILPLITESNVAELHPRGLAYALAYIGLFIQSDEQSRTCIERAIALWTEQYPAGHPDIIALEKELAQTRQTIQDSPTANRKDSYSE
jgi:eukaryotic-like serine/threonine-protein kinase